MRSDMSTKFYKEFVDYDAKRYVKLLSMAYDGSEWDYEIASDGKSKSFRVYNTKTISEIVTHGGFTFHHAWGPTCNGHKITGRTWPELADNVHSMLMFAFVGVKAVDKDSGFMISDLD